MEKLNSTEIRERFLNFFEKNDHLKIKASSVVPQNDPTLLFINSGMAPLKNYFLAKETPPHPRLCNFQPCIRTKDIDDVGDRHHLTIFEMMGSWSIGDYYKEEACRLAYELLVEGFGFDPKKLYMTVYAGNPEKGIPADTESIEAWKKCGVHPDHIIQLGEDNFWGPAGETGPCGPCTEVFFDTGPEHGPEYKPGGHFDDVSRYIEIWNAGVFMELNKDKSGNFKPLPLKSVDTGSGLERMAMVMNGYESVYETDLMAPLMEMVGNTYNFNDIKKARMICDHMRASSFIMAEGIAPSNEGQGYIPRRLIRKSLAAVVGSGSNNYDFTPVVDRVLTMLSPYYPLLNSGRDALLFNLKTEINEFIPVIKSGIKEIDEEVGRLSGNIFSGKKAFDLVTTHGLPFEVITSHLSETKLKIDEEEYQACWEEHRKTSRVISRKGGSTTDQDKVETLTKDLKDTEFTGYDHLESEAKVVFIISDSESVSELTAGSEGMVFFDQTPFYAESGGQAGDQGIIEGKASGEVLDTQKIHKLHAHEVKLTSGTLKIGDTYKLKVNVDLRSETMRHHSATHLLHSALHQVVGKHAIQKGSMVTNDRLRFDFQHPKALTAEEIEKIETLVNQWVRANDPRETHLLDYDAAIEKGAMALFGEKYDAKVRVVEFGGSVELCGGTHVERTGDIGLFVITSESSVAKGIRRVEACVGAEALKYVQQRNSILRELSQGLNAKPEDLSTRVKELQKKLKEKKKASAASGGALKANDEKIFEHAGLKHYFALVDGETKDIKDLGDRLADKGDHQLITLMAKDDKSIKAFVWVHKDQTTKVKAGDYLKKFLEPLEGRGGGKPHFAQGGSQKVSDFDKFWSSAENHAKSISL